jgi:hypothetical protein
MLAACVTASLSGMSHADTSLTATISNFHYALIDLDLNDGVTPTITISGQGFSPYPSSTSINATGTGWHFQYGTDIFQPVGGSLSGAQYSMSSGVTGSGTLQSAAQSTTTQLYNHDISSVDLSNTAGSGNSFFVLSANTRVEFFADAYVSVSTTGLLSNEVYNNQTAIASLVGTVDTSSGTLIYRPGITVGFNTRIDNPNASAPKSDSKTQVLGFSYDNLSSATVNGSFSALTQNFVSRGVLPTSPVPEPASYSLFGAGLLMLAAARARRRSKR